jgi:hypothetical protein
MEAWPQRRKEGRVVIFSCIVAFGVVLSPRPWEGTRRTFNQSSRHRATVDGSNAKPAHLCAGMLDDGKVVVVTVRSGKSTVADFPTPVKQKNLRDRFALRATGGERAVSTSGS